MKINLKWLKIYFQSIYDRWFTRAWPSSRARPPRLRLTLVTMFLFFKFHLFPYEAKSGSWSISNKSLVTRRPSFYCTMIIGDTNLNNSSIKQRSSSISIFYIWFEASYCSDFNEHFVGGVLYSKCKWLYQNMPEFWHEFQFF